VCVEIGETREIESSSELSDYGSFLDQAMFSSQGLIFSFRNSEKNMQEKPKREASLVASAIECET